MCGDNSLKLRKLEEKDAPLMLEWMHDSSVTAYLAKDFSSMTIENCKDFIESAQGITHNAHFAVVDDNDEYMGTVSLKNIELSSAEAEFAITMRKFAQGKGFARFAICEIIRTAIEEMNLKFVYWDVLKANLHAVHFYDKIGGKRIKDEKCSFYLTKMNIPTEKKSEYICFYADECI